MNTQIKILLYLLLVGGILYYIQYKYQLFDISFNKPVLEKQIEKEEESTKSLEILNSDGQKIYVEVEIADTPQLRQTGLSGRNELGDYQGMLFIFDTEGEYSFWMKDMNIPLDIIYIGYSSYIVDIKENQQPCEESNCPYLPVSVPFKYVLEVNSGFVQINKINIGNAIIFDILSEQ